MADSLELPQLHVEGDDDLHTVVQLLARHRIQLDKHLGPVQISPAHGDIGVLDLLATAVRASTNRPVGFVIDANGAVADRWRAVCSRLNNVDLDLPQAPLREGFIGDSAKLRARVGVWIMPDNRTDSGNLEFLIETLVPERDKLIGHADAATGKAIKLGAKFTRADRIKAKLHCWLAWQPEPGRPFGTAIKAHFFRHDSEIALRFVAWFQRLYASHLPDQDKKQP